MCNLKYEIALNLRKFNFENPKAYSLHYRNYLMIEKYCFALVRITAMLFVKVQHLSAADANKDSLRSIIKTSTDVKKRVDALNALAFEYRRSDLDSGIYYTRQAYALSTSIKYNTGIGAYYECMGAFLFYDNSDTALVLFRKAIDYYTLDNNQEKKRAALANMCNVFISANEYDSALYYAHYTLQSFQGEKAKNRAKNENSIMWLYQSLGNIFYYKSVYDSSLFYNYKGLEMANAANDENAKATFYSGIGNVYIQLGEYDKSIEAHLKWKNIAQQLKNYRGYVLALTNLADSHIEKGEYEIANEYADSALKYARQYEVYRHIPHNYNSLGLSKFKTGNCSDAINFYKLGLEACEKYKNDFIKGNLLLDYGNALCCMKDYTNAIVKYKAAIEYLEDDAENLHLCYAGMSDAYKALNDYKNAMHYMTLSNQFKDSVFNANSMSTIQDLNVKYETVNKEQQIMLLEKDNKLQGEIAEKESLKKNFAMLGAGLFLVFGFYLYYLLSIKKRQSIELETSLMNLKRTQSQLIQLEKEKEAEEVRLKISRDLHDDMGATLSGISVYSIAVKQRLEDKDLKRAGEMLDTISRDAQEMVTNMSDTVWMISSRNDTLEKLTDRLKLFASSILTAKNIYFLFEADEKFTEAKLKTEMRNHIYLLFKEAINNAAKYAECSVVKMNIYADAKGLHISLTDDGKGFDVTKVAAGNGIENMKQRAKDLNGVLNIVSEKGQGTMIELTCNTSPLLGSDVYEA